VEPLSYRLELDPDEPEDPEDPELPEEDVPLVSPPSPPVLYWEGLWLEPLEPPELIPRPALPLELVPEFPLVPLPLVL